MRRLPTGDVNAIQDARSIGPGAFAASRTLEQKAIAAPRIVRVDDGWLEWANNEPGSDLRLIPSGSQSFLDVVGQPSQIGPDALWEFIKLFRATDDEIADFARRYGVLFVNASGWPDSEPPTVTYEGETWIDGPSSGRGLPVPDASVPLSKTGYVWRMMERPVVWHREPLTRWRDWSLVFSLLLAFGQELRERETPIDAAALLREWDIDPARIGDDYESQGEGTTETSRIGDDGLVRVTPEHDHQWPQSSPRFLAWKWFPLPPGSVATAEEQRSGIGMWLDRLTTATAMPLHVNWDGGPTPRLLLGRSHLDDLAQQQPHAAFPDLLAYLISVLAGDRTVHVCPQCGWTYPATRRSGYCPECRGRRRRETKRTSFHRHPEWRQPRSKRGGA